MVMKRKAVSTICKRAVALGSSKVEEEQVDEEQMQLVEVKAIEKVEQGQRDLQATAIRAKEIKSMAVADLKELLLKEGLKTGKKEDMVKTLLAHEAKARAKLLAHEAKIRSVVLQKKEELDSQSVLELKRMCMSMGIMDAKTKEERVERLLMRWQEADGVDKALAQMAYDSRKEELVAMDEASLQKLCNKMHIDPYIAEVMVERISKREKEMGRYGTPALAKAEKAVEVEEKVDMVATLLLNEANRQKEKELKRREDLVVAEKLKDLKSMSIDELKKSLKKKGMEVEGKKDELVQALFEVGKQEEALAARKSALKAMSQEELKALLVSKGLTIGAKGTMVETLLAHEAKLREELAAYVVKAKEVLAKKKQALEAKSNKELKELCASKGLTLKVSTEKEERVERLLEEIEREGEIERIISSMTRQARRKELDSMDKPTLVKLCEETGADPIVKDVMVDRILSRENEGDEDVLDEPVAKKMRASKK